ncbi:PLP-dependent transferase [Bradyrhizobium sp. WSM1253]|uniref:PLP-dependent transferase n=1 Tax=Bradyrhizobium sp. WSM1253 TaxID=319003 RepID=UPI000683E81D
MGQHYEAVSNWLKSLQEHPAVDRLLHPGLPNDAGHNIWKRDFLGASGIFGLVLKPMSKAELSVSFSKLRLFRIRFRGADMKALCCQSTSLYEKRRYLWLTDL